MQSLEESKWQIQALAAAIEDELEQRRPDSVDDQIDVAAAARRMIDAARALGLEPGLILREGEP